jgi:hypothetical protein
VSQRAALIALVAAAVTALPAVASASYVKQYILDHPKREHCKVRYVKKVERVTVHGRKVKDTVCIHVPPKAVVPTAAPPAPTPGQGPTSAEAVIYGLIFVVPGETPCERCSPPPNVPRPRASVSDPGYVTVTNPSTGLQVEAQMVAAGSAGFRFIVPAGEYVLSVRDELAPTAYCPQLRITVAEGQQVNENMGCGPP